MTSTRFFKSTRFPLLLIGVALMAGILVTGCDSGGSDSPDEPESLNFGEISTEGAVSVDDSTSGSLDPSGDPRLRALADVEENDPITESDDEVMDVYEFTLQDKQKQDSLKSEQAGSKDAEGVTIRLNEVNNLDTELYLYEKGGEFVERDDDDGIDTNSKIARTLDPADYFVVVSADTGPEEGDGVGDYELIVNNGVDDGDDDDDGDDEGGAGGVGDPDSNTFEDTPTENVIGVGETASGSFQFSDALLRDIAEADAGDPVAESDSAFMDVYELSLQSRTDVTITLDGAGSSLGTELYLYEKEPGREATFLSRGASKSSSGITTTLSSGDYFVVAAAASADATGDYDLQVRETSDDEDDGDEGENGGSEPNDFSNTAAEGTISVGGSKSGALASSDASLSDIGDAAPNDPATSNSGAPIDIYTLDLSSKQKVILSMPGNSFDARILLYAKGSGGSATFRTSSDGGSDDSATISKTLSSGSYYVIASAASGNATGDYELSVKNPPADFSNTATESTISVGGSKSGTLASSDASLSDIADADPDDSVTESSGAKIDVYELSLSKQDKVDLNMKGTGNALDARLLLYTKGSGGSATLRTSSDGGSDNEASISTTLSAGTYYIVASAASASATGQYELSVTPAFSLAFWQLEDDGVVNIGDLGVSGELKESDAERSAIAGVDDAAGIEEGAGEPIDLYRIDLAGDNERGEPIAISQYRRPTGEDYNPKLYLYDGKGNFKDEIESLQSGVTITGSFDVDSLYVVPSSEGATGRSGKGTYKLDFVSTDDFDDVNIAETISLGTDTTVSISDSDSKKRHLEPILPSVTETSSGRADVYEFTLQSKQEFLIEKSIPEGSPFLDADAIELVLYNSSTEEIADIGPNDERIVKSQKDGTYYIYAGVALDAFNDRGKYNLTLARTGFDKVDPEGAIEVGDTKTGEFTESDAALGDIGDVARVPVKERVERMDVYTLSVNSSQEVTISMPNDSDNQNVTIENTSLFLFKKEGGTTSKVASDFASFSSEISQQLSPGAKYFVVATTYGRSAPGRLDTGSYVLKVKSGSSN